MTQRKVCIDAITELLYGGDRSIGGRRKRELIFDIPIIMLQTSI